MWKLVLGDYRYNLKSGFQRAWGEGGGFLYLYLMLIPVIVGEYEVYYYCCMLPVVLGVLLSRMFAGYKNKTLFLSPLSEEQRREYFKISYRIRVGSGFLVFLAAAGSQVIVGKVPVLLFALMTIGVVSFLMAINVYCQPVKNSRKVSEGQWQKALEREWKLPGHYEFWNITLQAGGFFLMLLLTAAVPDKNEVISDWEWVALAVVTTFFSIFAWRMVKKYYKPVMEQCVSYE